jgi:hypothetical protein
MPDKDISLPWAKRSSTVKGGCALTLAL